VDFIPELRLRQWINNTVFFKEWSSAKSATKFSLLPLRILVDQFLGKKTAWL
jgi:hypothetical protein